MSVLDFIIAITIIVLLLAYWAAYKIVEWYFCRKVEKELGENDERQPK